MGTQAHKQTMLAHAIRAAFKNNFSSSPAKCFQGGKPGHMKNDCASRPQTGVTMPPPTGDSRTPRLSSGARKAITGPINADQTSIETVPLYSREPASWATPGPTNNGDLRGEDLQRTLQPVSSLLSHCQRKCWVGPPNPSNFRLLNQTAPIAIPTGIRGPLPPGTAVLILGRSGLILKGLQILPGHTTAS